MDYKSTCEISSLDRIRYSKTSSKDFYNNYIGLRRPVLFNDQIVKSENFQASKKNWSFQNLLKRFQEKKTVEVKVEYRDNTNETFGRGQEMKMNFTDFLQALIDGTENYYLTTQDLDCDNEGRPNIIAPPLTELKSDVPLVPKLFDTLVLANMNIWIGQSSQYSTSGLHHDFHDNLYVMIKGTKQITLIPPTEAENLYTVGEIVQVHCNGRINYKNQITRADGADINADVALSASERLTLAASKLKELEDKDDKESNLEQEIEDEIDEAMEALLDAEHDDYVDSDDNDDDDKADEEADDDDDEYDLAEALEEFSEEESIEDKKETKQTKKRSNQESSSSNEHQNENKKQKKEKTTPSNFSQVKSSYSSQYLDEHFPNYSHAAKKAITITINEGEMLFIPAGWFHEVKSLGKEGHMALNYWFHPPDQMNYEQPYSSDFWKKDFIARNISWN